MSDICACLGQGLAGSAWPSPGFFVHRCGVTDTMRWGYRFVERRPDVGRVQLSPGDDLVIMASDGLWDVMDDQTAVDIAQVCAQIQALLCMAELFRYVRFAIHMFRMVMSQAHAGTGWRNMPVAVCVGQQALH